MDDAVEALLARPPAFLGAVPGTTNIAVSTRVRMARNLAALHFPVALDADALCGAREHIALATADAGVLKKNHFSLKVDELPFHEQEILFERRVASRALLNRGRGAGLEFTADGDACVMINEEDHLRIQVILPGLGLDEAFRRVNTMDDALGARLEYAFHPQFGFLTSRPADAGTGMRASVMLHLPGLVFTGEFPQVLNALGKMHFTMRGLCGEGTAGGGHFFQLSNQSTLGESEGQVLERLRRVAALLIDQEERAREELIQSKKNEIFDCVGRAFGTLRYGYKLDYPEALQALSILRLGVGFGMFDEVDIPLVNELFMNIQPAHLSFCRNKKKEDECDVARAAMTRERLRKKGDKRHA